MAFFRLSNQASNIKQKEFFNRQQKLIFNNGVRMENDQDIHDAPSTAKRLIGKSIDLSKYVLNFDAYYQDARKSAGNKDTLCKILYYLEDDTIKVCDPDFSVKILDRGCIIPRQRLKKESFFLHDDEYYTIKDFNIGECLEIFGVKYTLINCDSFTKEFLFDMGYRITTPEPAFVFLLKELQSQGIKKISSIKFYPKSYAVARFLQDYPKTLRFYGTWEDKRSSSNEKCLVMLYINVADGKFRVLEDRSLNFRAHDSRLLLKPTLVPKEALFDKIGQNSEQTLLNLCSNVFYDRTDDKCYSFKDPSFILDSNAVREKKTDYYTEKDIDLGIYLDIFGHQLYLYDCDGFTKEYYYKKYKKSLISLPKPIVSKSKII